jgi:hypothetical protein
MKFSFLNLDPEAELILRCARTTIDPENAEGIHALLQQDLDWSKVTQLAFRHGVVTLLYKNLNSTFFESVPHDILAQLKDHYTINLQSNLYLTNELISLFKKFTENEIRIIPYKGPVLTKSIYGDLGFRRFGDLDIIVHKRDIKIAKDVLLSQGYELTWPEIQLSEKQEASHIQTKYNYQFIREEDGVLVELHWDITPEYFSFPQSPDWLWQNLEAVTLSGSSFFTFSPEDYLVILCVHGGNHCWMQLVQMCDINEIIQKNPSLNWEQLVDESASQGSERMLLLGLLLSHVLLGTDLPDKIWEGLNNQPEVNTLADQVIQKFLANSWVGSGFFEIPRFHLKARDNLRARWHYLHALTIPSVKDWSFVRLPDSLDYLYFFVRPIRLGFEHGVIPIINQLNRVLR